MDPNTAPTPGEVYELGVAVEIAQKRAIMNGASEEDSFDVARGARERWRERQLAEAGNPEAIQKRFDELEADRKAIAGEVAKAHESLEHKGKPIPVTPVMQPITTGNSSGTPIIIPNSNTVTPPDLSQKKKLDPVEKELLRRRGHKVKGGQVGEKRADDQMPEKKKRELMKQSGIIFDDLPLNKHGHAQRLLAATREKIRFLVRPNGGAWIVYDEATGQWSTDAAPQRVGEHIVKLAYVMLDWANQAQAHAADQSLTADETQEFEMLVRLLQREHRSILSNVTAIRNHAAYIPASHITESAFDADPYSIAVKNGVLDLRTCKLTPHAPGNFVRSMLGVTYDPKATAPTFQRALDDALTDPKTGKVRLDVRAWMQMYVGSCLTGDVHEEMSLWNLGAGGTGKSTIWGTFADVLGSWSVRAPKGLLRVGYNGQFADADTVGKRLVLDSEWKQNQRIKTDSYLRLTGDKFHSPDVKNRQSVQERITHKLVIVANNPPVWDATDDSTVGAMARRTFIIQFEHRVVIKGDNYLVVPEKMLTEWDGIFAWMVEGCRQWQGLRAKSNSMRAIEPQIMQDWRDEYIASLGVVDPVDDGLTKAGYAWDRPASDTAWAEDILADVNKVMVDENRLLISADALAARLTEHGLTKRRKRKPGETSAKSCWSGISK